MIKTSATEVAILIESSHLDTAVFYFLSEVGTLLQDIATAIGLMMVFEGIMPFCLPERWRSMIARIAIMDNRAMRGIGLLSMLTGLSILVFLR